MPTGEAFLDFRNRIFGDLAGLRIHLADEQRAEIRVPDLTVAIDHHVVRFDGFARQIVFGDDEMRAAPGGPRQGVQRVAALRPVAEIDAGEPFRRRRACGSRARYRAHGIARAAAEIAPRRADQPLRLQRRAAGIVAGHAVEDLHEFIRVVLRIHDALVAVATVAGEQEFLLLVRARHARSAIRHW